MNLSHSTIARGARRKTSLRRYPHLTCGHVLIPICLSGIFYYVGLLFGMSHLKCENSKPLVPDPDLSLRGSDRLDEHELIDAIVAARIKASAYKQGKGKDYNSSSVPQFSETLSNFVHGMVKISQPDFLQAFDYGTPRPIVTPGSEEALIIYNTKESLPYLVPSLLQRGNSIKTLPVRNATANCDSLNVIYQNPNSKSSRCMAIVGNYESYHIQKWLRLGSVEVSSFTSVGRTTSSSGHTEFRSPSKENSQRHSQRIKQYLETSEHVLAVLKPIVESISIENTIIIMTVNSGQVDLLANFVCSAKRHKFDISNVLVFSTDPNAHKIVLGLGIASFYDDKNFLNLSHKAAQRYGDSSFSDMMYAKVLSVQLINALGYHVLFQDVDIVWYKHPLPFLQRNKSIQKHDLIFQDDGNRGPRFGPSSANSGFYFVRSNLRTQYLFISLLYSGDMIIESRSHQQVLIAKMNEHASLFGLRIKILNGEGFPCGFHYHRKKILMKEIVELKRAPYLFHMSWTENKVNKIFFFKQMGLWYMNENCLGNRLFDAFTYSVDKNVEKCCVMQPLVTCHFKDKPSIIPCKNSPPLDKGGKSFW